MAPEWEVSTTLPASYREALPAALAEANASLEPACEKAMAVALGKLGQWIEMFGVAPLPDDKAARQRRLAEILRAYREQLADLPGDLLVKAVEHVISSATYRVLPLPGELRKAVEAEHRKRVRDRARVQVAIRLGRFEREPMPEAARTVPRLPAPPALPRIPAYSDDGLEPSAPPPRPLGRPAPIPVNPAKRSGITPDQLAAIRARTDASKEA